MNQASVTHPLPTHPGRQFQIKIEEHASANLPTIKRKFPSILPPINTEYIVETHYQASSFQNSFEQLKKVIIDLAGDKEENCEYDIIVKKRKITKSEPVQAVLHAQMSLDKRPFQPLREENPHSGPQISAPESANDIKEDDDEYDESDKEDNSTADHLNKGEGLSRGQAPAQKLSQALRTRLF